MSLRLLPVMNGAVNFVPALIFRCAMAEGATHTYNTNPMRSDFLLALKNCPFE